MSLRTATEHLRVAHACATYPASPRRSPRGGSPTPRSAPSPASPAPTPRP
jgi:hypothetical protein